MLEQKQMHENKECLTNLLNIQLRRNSSIYTPVSNRKSNAAAIHSQAYVYLTEQTANAKLRQITAKTKVVIRTRPNAVEEPTYDM
jgi:hypothetical protein